MRAAYNMRLWERACLHWDRLPGQLKAQISVLPRPIAAWASTSPNLSVSIHKMEIVRPILQGWCKD